MESSWYIIYIFIIGGDLIASVIDHKFDLLYSKRAFVHWYVGEGMEEVGTICVLCATSPYECI
jgi:hypothetical protein